MAKDNPEASTAQYKVLITPTDVGLLVLKRLQRPARDKSAELRRLIESGYAAEQAGFILDRTILRNGGRVWDVQLVLDSEPGQKQRKAAKTTRLQQRGFDVVHRSSRFSSRVTYQACRFG